MLQQGGTWRNEKGVGPLRPGVTSFQRRGQRVLRASVFFRPEYNAVRHTRWCPFRATISKKRKSKKKKSMNLFSFSSQDSVVFIILFGRWPMLLLACHKPERRVLALFRLISKSTGVLFGPSLLYFSRVVYIFFPLKGETKKNIRKKEKGKWFFFFFCGIFKSPALDSYFGLVSCFYLFLFSILHVDGNNTRIVMCWDSSSN